MKSNEFSNMLEKLALDRKFKTQEERLAAILDDAIEGRIPYYRYWELLHENLRPSEGMEAMTFLDYAKETLRNPQNGIKDNAIIEKIIGDYFKNNIGKELFWPYALPEKCPPLANLEKLDIKGIYKAIGEQQVSFLHFDEHKGYVSMLDHLSGLKGNEYLVRDLFSIANKNKYDDAKAQQVLLYLSESKVALNEEILSVRQTQIMLSDISCLNGSSFSRLLQDRKKGQNNDTSSILEKVSIEDSADLYAFYGRKFGFKPEDCKKVFKDGYGNSCTMLEYAIDTRDTEIVEIMLTGKTEAEIKEMLTVKAEKDGLNALQTAFSSKGGFVVSILFKKAPNVVKALLPSTKRSNQQTLLHQACENPHNDPALLSMVFKNARAESEALLTSKDYMGYTILHHLMFKKNKDFINVIVDEFPDRIDELFSIEDKEKRTPLYLLCERGTEEFIIDVLKKVPQLRKQISEGNTFYERLKVRQLTGVLDEIRYEQPKKISVQSQTQRTHTPNQEEPQSLPSGFFTISALICGSVLLYALHTKTAFPKGVLPGAVVLGLSATVGMGIDYATQAGRSI